MKPSSSRLLAILVSITSVFAMVPSGLGALELPGIDMESAAYREQILAEVVESSVTSEMVELQREAKLAQSEQRWRDAVEVSKHIVAANPDDFFAWIALAAAWRNTDATAVEISAAAYQALTLADNDDKRAEALLLIIENLDRRQQIPLFRQALREAGKLVSNHAIDRLVSEPSSSKADQAPAQEDGAKPDFELEMVALRLDEAPDTNVSVPVACAVFTAELQEADVDHYRRYVEIVPEPNQGYEIRVEKQQLCVLGLEFATDYEITLRAGLPALDGRELEDGRTELLKTTSIPKQISFRGQALFLPEHGEGLVPVSTINIDELELTLLRIGDRNLINAIALGQLENRINAADVVLIRDTTGEIIWRGSVEINSEPNTPVLTGIPVRDLTNLHRRLGEPETGDGPEVADILPGVMVDADRIGKVDPGVYALVARSALDAADDPDFATAAENKKKLATQWLTVTDLGLSLFKSRHDLLVSARSLSDGKPRQAIGVQLVTKNNRVVGEAVTDRHGIARLDSNLARGKRGNALASVLALANDGEFAFLDATTDMVDLGDRGIDGRLPAGVLDAFVYTERGIYRPGESVNVGIIVRDSAGRAIDRASMPPLNYTVRAPNDREILNNDLTEPRDGAYSLTFDVPETALSGLWQIDVKLGRGGEQVGAASFEVGDFLPGRIDLKLEPIGHQALTENRPMNLNLVAEYLYGAPAAALPGEALVEIRETLVPWAATNYKAFASGVSAEDFSYGLTDEDVAPRRTRLDLLRTDRQGRTTVSVRAEIPQSTQPLEALIEIQLFDTDGSRTKETLRAPVRSDQDWIGILQRSAFPRGGATEFDILYIDASGAPLPQRPLSVRVYRLRDAYVWQKEFLPYYSAAWSYEPQIQLTRLWDEDRSVVTNEQGIASVRVVMEELGRYLIEVRSDDSAAASLRFDSGWTGVPEVPGSPDLARLTVDRETYAPGDKARLSVEAPFDGEGLFLVGNERILHWVTAPVSAAGTELTLDIRKDWGPCAYVIGSVFRTETDASRERGPGRAIGLAHFCVAETDRRLKVKFTNVPRKIAPNRSLDMRLQVDGVAPGEEAHVSLALVDRGILGLTNFNAPVPEDYFFGKRQLGVDVYDAYDRVILSEGTRAVLRSGGGYGPLRGLRYASPIILSQFSGIVPVGLDGMASVSFDVPDFSGQVELMAVAWSRDRFGSAQKIISVTQPVLSRLRLPRFLAPGDLARSSLSIQNRTGGGEARPFAVELTLDGPLVFADRSKHMRFDTPSLGQYDVHRQSIEISPQWTGEGRVQIKVTDPLTSITYERERMLSVRPPHPERTRRFATLLEPHASIDLVKQFRDRIGAEFLDDDLSLAVRISPESDRLTGLAPSDWLSPSLPYLDSLIGYAQRLLPRIPPPAATPSSPAQSDGRGDQEALQKVVHGISGLQTTYGFFRTVRQERVYYTESEDTNRIAQTIKALEVLVAARDKGLRVSEAALRSVISFVERIYRSNMPCDYKPEAWLPSAAYLLTRTSRLKRTDLDALRDCKFPADDVTSLSYLAAAHCLFGLKEACHDQFQTLAQRAAGDNDGGLSLDEKAMTLALMVESGIGDAVSAPLRRKVKAALNAPRTQTELSIEARAALKRSFADSSATDLRSFDVKIDGSARTVEGMVHRIDKLRLKDIQDSFFIENLLPDKELALELLVRGVPLLGGRTDAEGFEVERIFYDLDGNTLDLSHDELHAGQLFVVEIHGQVPRKEKRQVMLVNLMPAGTDVEETDLLERQPLSPKLRQVTRRPTDQAVFAKVPLRELRDDRFFAILDFDNPSRTRFRVHFLARALVAGNYSLPEVLIEDLEHPEISARAGAGSVKITPNETGP